MLLPSNWNRTSTPIEFTLPEALYERECQRERRVSLREFVPCVIQGD